MHTLLSNPITIFPTYEAAKKVADVNAEGDDVTDYRVCKNADDRFTIAMYEDGEFVMCL